MSATQARRVALKVVGRVRHKGAWAHEALASALKANPMEPREVALATRLAYGTLEMGGVLDEVLARHLSAPEKLQPQLMDALRVATFEILLLDTPSHAAVHQGVELAGAVSPRTKGLANAVLRKVAEEALRFPFGDPDTELSATARLRGFPEWLSGRLAEEFGEQDAKAFMDAHASPAPAYIAHNPFLGEEDALIEMVRESGAELRRCGPPGCFIGDSAGLVLASPAIAAGRGVVADMAAQAIVAMTPIEPGMRIADIGAGRGSKTLLMQANAFRKGGLAEIIAIDTHEFKVEVLRKRMRDLAVPGVTAARADATSFDELFSAAGGPVDLAFVDAPCSGAGTLRRNPDKRWKMSASDISRLAALGGRLLDSAARLVRPGGFVVYSTCTIFAEENDKVVDDFLRTAAGEEFVKVDFPGQAGWGLTARPLGEEEQPVQEGRFATWPSTGGPDGHFAAALRKKPLAAAF